MSSAHSNTMRKTMEQIITNLASQYPTIMAICVCIGGFFLGLAIFRPLLYWIVKKTPSETDDKAVAKLYYIFDYLSPDLVGVFVTIFRKKKPDVAQTMDKIAKAIDAVQTDDNK